MLSGFKSSDWNYRIAAARSILINAKDVRTRKAVAVDLLANLPLAIQVSKNVSLGRLVIGKRFLATFRVYTSKNIDAVEGTHVDFFEILDVDQSFEDFVRAYWVYPKHVAFELTKIEPL